MVEENSLGLNEATRRSNIRNKKLENLPQLGIYKKKYGYTRNSEKKITREPTIARGILRTRTRGKARKK